METNGDARSSLAEEFHALRESVAECVRAMKEHDTVLRALLSGQTTKLASARDEFDELALASAEDSAKIAREHYSLDWAPLEARPKSFNTPKQKKDWWTQRNALIRADIRTLRANPKNLIGKRGKPVLNLPDSLHEKLGKKHGCGLKNTHMRESEVRKGKTD